MNVTLSNVDFIQTSPMPDKEDGEMDIKVFIAIYILFVIIVLSLYGAYTEHESIEIAAQVAIFCMICHGSKNVNWKCLNCEDLVCNGCKRKHDRAHIVVKRRRERMICYSECWMCFSFIEALYFCQDCKIHLCDKCIVLHLSEANNRRHFIREDNKNIKEPYNKKTYSSTLPLTKTSADQSRRIFLSPPIELYSFHIFLERRIGIHDTSDFHADFLQANILVSPGGSILVEGRLVCPKIHNFTHKDCTMVCLSCETSCCDTCLNKGFHPECRKEKIHSVTHTLKWKILDQNRLCRRRIDKIRSRLQHFNDFLYESRIENNIFRLFYNVDKQEFIVQLHRDIDVLTHNLSTLLNEERELDTLCEDGKGYNMYYFASNVPYLTFYQNLMKNLQPLEKCPFEQIKKKMQRVQQSGNLSLLSNSTDIDLVIFSNEFDVTTERWQLVQTGNKTLKTRKPDSFSVRPYEENCNIYKATLDDPRSKLIKLIFFVLIAAIAVLALDIFNHL